MVAMTQSVARFSLLFNSALSIPKSKHGEHTRLGRRYTMVNWTLFSIMPALMA
jgi:hypothetical protein